MSILGTPTRSWMYDNPHFLPEPAKYMVCGSLSTESSKLDRLLKSRVEAFERDLEYMENLMNMPFKTVRDTLSDLNDIYQGIDDVIPNVSNLASAQAIESFVNNCLFLKNHPLLGNYYKLAQSLLDEYQEQFRLWTVDQITRLPTYEITDWFQTNVVDKMNNSQVYETVQDYNRITACMNAICVLDSSGNPIQELESSLDQSLENFQNLKTRLRILPDSEDMNKDDFFSSMMNKAASNAGLDPRKKFILNESLTTYKQSKTKFDQSHANIVQIMKNVEEGNTWNTNLPYTSTQFYTHYNEPEIYSYSALFDHIFDNNVIGNYTDIWTDGFANLHYPVGTTYKTENTDVLINIMSAAIIETRDPETNCFTTYQIQLDMAIGKKSCFLTWEDENDGSIFTVEHVNHGLIGTNNYVIFDNSGYSEIDGKKLITVVDQDHYTFNSDFLFVDSTGEFADVYTTIHEGTGNSSIGIPARSKCGEYSIRGLTGVTHTELVYMRRTMSNAVLDAMEVALKLFTVLEIERQIPY